MGRPVVHGRQVPWRQAVAMVACAFGVATSAQGGQVIFGSDATRVAVGHYVPFVLWFNFVAGFAYVVTGVDTPTPRCSRRRMLRGRPSGAGCQLRCLSEANLT